jgi:DNA-binding transcriptional ArsR family regulator
VNVPQPHPPQIPPETLELIELVARRLRLLGQPLRIQILHALDEGEMSVQALADRLAAGQDNVSRHVGLLRDAGLVKARHDGRMVWYRLRDRDCLVYFDEVARWIAREVQAPDARQLLEVGDGDG